MPVQQTPQWTEFLTCPVCQKEFQAGDRLPVSLTCGHTICTPCLDALQGYQCPLDQNKIGMEMHKLPVNTALLKLIGNGHIPERLRTTGDLTQKFAEIYRQCMKSLETMALYLKPQTTNQLSRPLQRKLVILVTSQLLNDEGRGKGVRAARSVGERCVLELILQHQNPFHLSTNLWAAVRARGCQFLGPPMQEDALKLVLNALQDGNTLSRKVLVMFVVQRLVKASKTSIGHVVQLLYRASCFKVTKRDGDSSLMQLKEELRNYESLRKEHDTQIVQIAIEAGLRIGPDQWSSLLYGDYAHKSHMQSIIDKLQTPQSFSQSVQELLLALQRFGDPGNLSSLRGHFQVLTSIDSNIETKEAAPGWPFTLTAILAAEAITAGMISFSALNTSKRTGEPNNSISKYKTSICRDFSQYGCCVRGPNCTFAHCTAELEYHRTNNNSRSREQRFDRSSKTPSHTTTAKPSNSRHEDEDLSDHKMVNTTDMKRSETKDLDDGTEDMPQMEPIHIKYFPLGPDGSRRVDTAAPPPSLNDFYMGNKQLLPIKDHDQTKQQQHLSGLQVVQQQQQLIALQQQHAVQQHTAQLQKLAQHQHMGQHQQQAAQQQLLATQHAAQLQQQSAQKQQQAAQQQQQDAQQQQHAVKQQQQTAHQHQAAQQQQQTAQQQQQAVQQQQQAAQQQNHAVQQQQQAAQQQHQAAQQQHQAVQQQNHAVQQQQQAAQQQQQAAQQQQQAAQQQQQAVQKQQQAVQQQQQVPQQQHRAEQQPWRQHSVVAFPQQIQQHTIVGATEPMQQIFSVNSQMVAPHNAQETQKHGIINITRNTAAFQQPLTATMANTDIAHLQTLVAVNQIGAAQVVESHQLANNVNHLSTRPDRTSNQTSMMQDHLNIALAGQQNKQLGRAEAVSRAHLNAAVAQGQFNVANDDIISVQPGEFPAPGIGVAVVRPPVQLHIQQVPHPGQSGSVMGIPTQRAIAAPLHQTQTQQTSVLAQMQHGTTQMSVGGRVHSNLPGQIAEQQMVMVPAGNTQMSPLVDANGSPLIDVNTGQPLLAAHTPMVAASPIHQQVIDGNTPAQIIAASPLHQLSDGTIVQNTLQVQAPMRRMSHDVSPELASKSLQALEERKEEIISELEDIVGPTAAKAIGNLTYKQASKQKFGGIEAAVKQSSPAFETTLGNTSLNGIYGIWTSKPIATLSSILSNTCKASQQMRESSAIYTAPTTKCQSVEDEVSPLPEGICVSRFGPISRRNIVTNPGIQSESLPRSVTSSIMSENTLSDSGLRNFPRSSLMSDITVTKSRVEERSNVLEYNPGYYFDYMEGMDSVMMRHLANPPMLPASPMPPVKIRDNGVGQQNYNFLVESSRIQNELQELQRRLSCLSVAENSVQMVHKRDRLAFELRMIEGGIQERHQETHTSTSDFPY